MRTASLLLFAGFCLGSGTAWAQEPPQDAPVPAPAPRPAPRWRSPVETFIGPALRTGLGEAMKGLAPAIPMGGPMRRHPGLTARVTFKPAAQRVVPDKVAASLKGLDAKGRRTAAKSFRDILDGYEKGAPKYDIAEALAFCLDTCRRVAADGKSLVDLEISGRATVFLPASEAFQAMKDRDRQAMYESLILTGGMVGGLAKQAEGQDKAAALQAQAMARQVLAAFGMAAE
jgi:hypothetical protein